MKQRFACDINMTNFAHEMFFQIVGGYSPILANDTRKRNTINKNTKQTKNRTQDRLYMKELAIRSCMYLNWLMR